MAKSSDSTKGRQLPTQRKKQKDLERILAEQLEPVIVNGIQLGFALLTSFLTKKLMSAPSKDSLDSKA